MITLPERRSQWAKTKAPEPPIPGVLPSNVVRLVNSLFSSSRRVDCAVVLVGSASIHFCMVVHILGMGLPGVSVAIAAREARLLLAVSCEGAGHVLLMLDIGSVACHSPSLCATPRHTSGRRKSAGVHTLPCMNLYRRPFSNRA